MNNNLVMAGIVAAREFNLNPETVKVMVVPSDSKTVIVQGVNGGKSVTLQRRRVWQDGSTVFIAYSRLNDTLVVRGGE